MVRAVSIFFISGQHIKFGSLQTILDLPPYVEHLDRFQNMAELTGVLKKDD